MKKMVLVLFALLLPGMLFASPTKDAAGSGQTAQATEITVGTSGPGSVAFTWVSTLATVLEQKGAPVRIRVAGDMPDVEAFRIMQRGARGVDASLGTGTTLARAMKGIEPFTSDEKFDNLRAVFLLGLSPIQTVARKDSGITKFEDFNGKRITGGAVGSGPDTFLREFMPKMYPNINVQIVPMAFSGVSAAMQDRRIDGYLTFGAAPYPAIVETMSLVEINFIDIDQAVQQRWFREHPEHHTMIVAKNSYEGQTNDLISLGHVAHLLTGINANEGVIYELTKKLLDPSFRDALIAATVTWAPAYEGLANNMYFDDLRGLGIKLHPGAARAFEEAGYTITGLK
ncbi:MAG: TAXI family TRAP transporter solute-binding subunit [Treponema sp.]|jgi:TRAP transporter TAXI family solute receptor|nr:TAXI family TRAP transporter solute-binding subunit [Treponema sp.]